MCCQLVDTKTQQRHHEHDIKLIFSLSTSCGGLVEDQCIDAVDNNENVDDGTKDISIGVCIRTGYN